MSLSDNFRKVRSGELDAEAITERLTLGQAYQIQKVNLESFGHQIGWKLGGSNRATRDAFYVNEPYFGPIYDDNYVNLQNSANASLTSCLTHAELEITIQLAGDFEQLHYEKGKIGSAISRLYLSLEFPFSNFKFPQQGVEYLVADQCATGGLILLSELSISGRDYSLENTENLRLMDNSTQLLDGNTRRLIPDLLGVLDDFLILASNHGFKVRPGDLIASGGISPCVELPRGRDISLMVDDKKIKNFKIME